MESFSFPSRKKLVLCSMLFFAVLLPSLATVPASFGQSSNQSSPSAKHASWLVQESITCLNIKFCVNQGGLFSISISATTFSDKTAVVNLAEIFFGRSHQILAQEVEYWVVTQWKTKMVHQVPEFELVSGTMYNTLWYRGHYSQTKQTIHNYVTGVPRLPITLNCQQVLGAPCPANVSAILTVTKV